MKGKETLEGHDGNRPVACGRWLRGSWHERTSWSVEIRVEYVSVLPGALDQVPVPELIKEISSGKNLNPVFKFFRSFFITDEDIVWYSGLPP